MTTAIDFPKLRDFVNRAHQGDSEALVKLREVFKSNPDGLIAIAGGDISQHARDEILEGHSSSSKLMQEAVSLKVDRIRDDLAGPSPTPIERILAERAALCWLDAYRADFVVAKIMNKKDGYQQKSVEFHEARRDRAHRRFLSAIKTLATVRKLAVPVIQLNVAQRQVNFASP